MYPDSYPQWCLKLPVCTTTDSKTRLEIRDLSPAATLTDNLKCANGCVSTFVRFGQTSRSIIDYEPNSDKCVLVKLSGPVLRCQNCRRTIEIPSIGHNIPSKMRISRDVLPPLLNKMINYHGQVTRIAQEFGIGRSTAEALIRRTVNQLTGCIITYKPCMTLLFLPFIYGNRKAMIVGGISGDGEAMLYDLLPTYSKHGVKTTLQRLSGSINEIRCIVIDFDKDVYDICRSECPNATIEVSYNSLINYLARQRHGVTNMAKALSFELKRGCRSVNDEVKSWYGKLSQDDQDAYSDVYETLIHCGDAIEHIYDTQNMEKKYQTAFNILDKFRNNKVCFDTMRYLILTSKQTTGLTIGSTSVPSGAKMNMVVVNTAAKMTPVHDMMTLLCESVLHDNAKPVYNFHVRISKLTEHSIPHDVTNDWECRDSGHKQDLHGDREMHR